MLKEARYKCWGFVTAKVVPGAEDLKFPEFNRVVYVIIGDCCYFSGIERRLRTSTVNAAESIVKAISEQEEVAIERLRWFDLQTRRGYQWYAPGKYELQELLIGPSGDLTPQEGGIAEVEIAGETAIVVTPDEEDFVVTGWRDAPCPPEVLELFREYIGEERKWPPDVVTPEEAEQRGFSPTDLSLPEVDGLLRSMRSLVKLESYYDKAMLVVDNEGRPDYLSKSEGHRYTLWLKDDIPP